MILIPNKEGLAFKRTLEEKKPVILSVKLDVDSYESQVVDVDFWISNSEKASVDFLAQIEPLVRNFGPKINFQIRYKFADFSTMITPDVASKFCFSKGEFCATTTHNLSPLSVLDEAVSQICAFDLSRSEKNSFENFFKYITLYSECLGKTIEDGKSLTVDLDCFKKIKSGKALPVSFMNQVESCYASSFKDPKDKLSDNSVLRSKKTEDTLTSINLIPAVFVNGGLVKENLDIIALLSAICSKMLEKPAYCNEALTSGIDWTASKQETFGKGKKVSFVLILASGFVLLLVIHIIRKYHKKKINDEISLFIQSQVDSYMKNQESRVSNQNI